MGGEEAGLCLVEMDGAPAVAGNVDGEEDSSELAGGLGIADLGSACSEPDESGCGEIGG